MYLVLSRSLPVPIDSEEANQAVPERDTTLLRGRPHKQRTRADTLSMFQVAQGAQNEKRNKNYPPQ